MACVVARGTEPRWEQLWATLDSLGVHREAPDLAESIICTDGLGVEVAIEGAIGLIQHEFSSPCSDTTPEARRRIAILRALSKVRPTPDNLGKQAPDT